MDFFSGIKFWLSHRVPSRSRYIKEIERHGGQLVILENQADMLIVDHMRKGKDQLLEDSFSYTYIDDSIKLGRPTDKEEHRVASNTHAARPAGATNISKRKFRVRFTTEDETFLSHWMQTTTHRTKGGEAFKELEAVNGRHTWQSWRDHWLKHMNCKPTSSLPVATPPTPPETSASPSGPDMAEPPATAPPRPAARRNQQKVVPVASNVVAQSQRTVPKARSNREHGTTTAGPSGTQSNVKTIEPSQPVWKAPSIPPTHSVAHGNLTNVDHQAGTGQSFEASNRPLVAEKALQTAQRRTTNHPSYSAVKAIPKESHRVVARSSLPAPDFRRNRVEDDVGTSLDATVTYATKALAAGTHMEAQKPEAARLEAETRVLSQPPSVNRESKKSRHSDVVRNGRSPASLTTTMSEKDRRGSRAPATQRLTKSRSIRDPNETIDLGLEDSIMGVLTKDSPDRAVSGDTTKFDPAEQDETLAIELWSSLLRQSGQRDLELIEDAAPLIANAAIIKQLPEQEFQVAWDTWWQTNIHRSATEWQTLYNKFCVPFYKKYDSAFQQLYMDRIGDSKLPTLPSVDAAQGRLRQISIELGEGTLQATVRIDSPELGSKRRHFHVGTSPELGGDDTRSNGVESPLELGISHQRNSSLPEARSPIKRKRDISDVEIQESPQQQRIVKHRRIQRPQPSDDVEIPPSDDEYPLDNPNSIEVERLSPDSVDSRRHSIQSIIDQQLFSEQAFSQEQAGATKAVSTRETVITYPKLELPEGDSAGSRTQEIKYKEEAVSEKLFVSDDEDSASESRISQPVKPILGSQHTVARHLLPDFSHDSLQNPEIFETHFFDANEDSSIRPGTQLEFELQNQQAVQNGTTSRSTQAKEFKNSIWPARISPPKPLTTEPTITDTSLVAADLSIPPQLRLASSEPEILEARQEGINHDLDEERSSSEAENIGVNQWIERKVRKGHERATLLLVLNATTMDTKLAHKTLAYYEKFNHLPSSRKGVWTEEDDKMLCQYSRSAKKQLMKKHGNDGLALRKAHLVKVSKS